MRVQYILYRTKKAPSFEMKRPVGMGDILRLTDRMPTDRAINCCRELAHKAGYPCMVLFESHSDKDIVRGIYSSAPLSAADI